MHEDRRVRRTKQTLKNILVELIALKGYETITVKDIVEYADYNRTTFYRHYSHKEEILNELIEEMINKFIEAFRAPYVNSKTIKLPQLRPSDIKIFHHIYENLNFYRLLKMPNGLPGFQEMLMDTVVFLYKNEVVHFHSPDSEINNNLCVTFSAYGFIGLMREWILSDFNATPDYMATQYVRILNYKPVNISIVSSKSHFPDIYNFSQRTLDMKRYM